MKIIKRKYLNKKKENTNSEKINKTVLYGITKETKKKKN